ncbi:hypothetical protein M5J20_02415 [Corynebacterium sp. TA-R-1]|uniref:Uncharacterized protein n=1 Tax=Corynebacterium stercoris TaxID=2943490 RepID=A0ABT1FZ62_9CORY|nr:hypothetical protein [Corynebacterium stercoris]MCP1387046.1 hypothetical protein [Corynebacterium stercoris]
MGEGHFPTLERDLEAQEALTDISQYVYNGNWEILRTNYPAGSIVRLTAPGMIVDSRYLASTLADITLTLEGVSSLSQAPSQIAETKRKGGNQNKQKRGHRRNDVDPLHPEDAIPDGPLPLVGSVMTGEVLRGLIKTMKGLFSPGVHLLLRSECDPSGSVTVRLQDGYDFLNADPSVLFSRYGVAPQEWTVVGVVGHYANEGSSDLDLEFVNESSVNRGKIANLMAKITSDFGTVGLLDLPRFPGFSIVPWAVYRTLNPAKLREEVEARLPASNRF